MKEWRSDGNEIAGDNRFRESASELAICEVHEEHLSAHAITNLSYIGPSRTVKAACHATSSEKPTEL